MGGGGGGGGDMCVCVWRGVVKISIATNHAYYSCIFMDSLMLGSVSIQQSASMMKTLKGQAHVCSCSI